jgi:hypothetical protein
MAANTMLRNRIEALERALGDRGTRLVIRGGLPEGAQATPADSKPTEPKSEPPPSEPAK